MKKKLFNGFSPASLILLFFFFNRVQPLASPFISPNGLVFANNITKSETSSSQKSPNLTALSNKNTQIDSKKEKNLKKVLTTAFDVTRFFPILIGKSGYQATVG
ncbi:MAG: hypothetical protein ACLUP5_01800 [Streptococcus sp.]